jgi:nitric oxide reductase subunit B
MQQAERAAKISFWSLNIGLAWMVFATLFPLGVLQLYHSLSVGYFDAGSLKFLSNHINFMLEWLRLPGDALFILGGTLPVLYLCWLGVSSMKAKGGLESSSGVLFTEIVDVRRSGA